MTTDHLPAAVTFSRTVDLGNGPIDVIFREARRPKTELTGEDETGGLGLATFGWCPPLNPRVYEPAPGIVCEQDVAVQLRDGTTIYADIFRPADGLPAPLLVSWSSYGKRPGDGMSEWQVMGVPPGTVSTMAKFESPDPAYWCHHGYAIANVDPRGVGNSEGDIQLFNTQDGKDGHDFIVWAAAQPWCTGKVGMAGNSMVAMVQYQIAAQRPPHLAAIAPWEGTSDVYRESMFEGGIPAISFNQFIVGSLTGPGGVDDQVANALAYPLMNDYWRDKIADMSQITVPTYLTACWNHFHLRGSVQAFRKIKSRRKWIRFHREFEWPDAYCSAGVEELRAFFDRYLKDIHNGWEMTPRVRLEVMDAYDFDLQTNRAEESFPIKRTEYRRLFLDATTMSLDPEPVAHEGRASYDPATQAAVFDIAFSQDTEITGYMKAHLFVQADGHDDMDLFVTVKKADAAGAWVPVSVLGEPHPGAWGKMRVSRRALDENESTSFQPVQSHLVEQKLVAGEVVEVDVEIVPSSRIWHAGERLRLEIAGRYIREGWFEPLTWETDNRGLHVIHTGGSHASYLQVPVVPPKYQVGDYVVR